MIDRFLSENGVALLTTVGQTLVVTSCFAIASARVIARKTTEIPADLEQRFLAIRRKWAGRDVSNPS